MRLYELLGRRGKRISSTRDVEIQNLACNTRDVTAGTLFFCFKGGKFDGHDFITQAKHEGAVAFITEREIPGENCVVMKDVRGKMAQIAKKFYGNVSDKLKIVTVTGTNGKTTTTHIVQTILNYAGIPCGLIGTCGVRYGGVRQDSDLTTPDPIMLHKIFKNMYDAGMQVVVMEASAHSIYYKKLLGLQAEVGIFTNLTQDHLDFFKTLRRYASVKKNYFCAKYVKRAVVNCDDETGRDILGETDVVSVSYGIDGGADYTAGNIVSTARGVDYILNVKGMSYPVHFSIPGRFNVYNSAAAIAACVALGVKIETAIEGASRLTGVEGRFDIMERSNGSKVVIDYAHTPDALENLLKSAREICANQLICVFGCGGNRDVKKRKIMGGIASTYSDLTIVTSDNPRSEEPLDIIADIEKGILRNKYYMSLALREDAIRYALNWAGEGDVVVIAGKGHENYQEIRGKKYTFSDRDTALKYF